MRGHRRPDRPAPQRRAGRPARAGRGGAGWPAAGRRSRPRTGCCPPAGDGDRAADRWAWAGRPPIPRRPRARPAGTARPDGTARRAGSARRAGPGVRGPTSGPGPRAPGVRERPGRAGDRAADRWDAAPRYDHRTAWTGTRGPRTAGREPRRARTPPTAGPGAARGAADRGRDRRCATPHLPRGDGRGRHRWRSHRRPTPAACARRVPRRWRTGTSRTPRDPATCSGPACWRCRALSRARAHGPCLPLHSLFLGGRRLVPLDLEPSVEARSWCDLHSWLMTGRPCSHP